MLDANGEWLLFSDADLSTPIEEFEKLYAAVSETVPIAIGSRALDRSLIGVHQSQFRERAGQVFNSCRMRAALGLDIVHDTQCGFKLFRRDCRSKAILLPPESYSSASVSTRKSCLSPASWGFAPLRCPFGGDQTLSKGPK